MSLFTQTPIDPDRGRRRGRAGWIVLGVAVGLITILGVAPAPYVIDRPGPVYNTLGTVEHDGEEVPLISIEDAETYPTEGALDLLTVNQYGTPSQRPSWFEIASAWFAPSEAVVPIDAAFPPDVSQDDIQEQNQTLMVDSQQDAIAAALLELGYDFPRDVTVSAVEAGSPADGQLEVGDVITAVNGVEVNDIAALRTAVAENGTGKPAELAIDRDGTDLTASVTPIEAGGNVILGIGVHMDYDFPIDVEIRLDDVGGPSAGQMFALGIIDTLTPGALNGGEHVAGTGTIDSTGTIGAIGGIRQKMFGARDAGATWFLAPRSNCNEVVGHIPPGIRVFAVEDLDDSLEILQTIADDGDTSSLPTCDAD